jgi:hypothetical protein
MMQQFSMTIYSVLFGVLVSAAVHCLNYKFYLFYLISFTIVNNTTMAHVS